MTVDTWLKIAAALEPAHQIAVEHGWWALDDQGKVIPRPEDEGALLIISELIEAFEEYRNNKPDFYVDEAGKPQGYVVEVADAMIRCADLMGGAGEAWPVPVPAVHLGFFGRNNWPADPANRPAGLFQATREISQWGTTSLHVVALTLMGLCAHQNLDIVPAIEAKIAYNRTRPFRHGGKRC